MPDTHAAMTTPAPEAPIFSAITEPAQSKSQDKILDALFAFQQAVAPIKKDQVNDHLHTKYTDLTGVWAAIREPLKLHELLIIQENVPYSRGAMVTTTVVHMPSKEWRASTVYIPARKADAQAFGSAISYARRYGLMTVLSLLTTDDDGHAATVAPPASKPIARSPMAGTGSSDEAEMKGWQNWSQKMMLQIQGCESEQALVQLWTGMQPELKQAPDEVRFGLTALKDSEKEKWSRDVGIDVGPDKGAAGDDVPF